MKKKWIIKILILLIVIIIVGYFWGMNEIRQDITVMNNSQSSIESIKVNYCSDEEWSSFNIAPRSFYSEKIVVICDSSFDVRIVFDDGSSIEKKNLGYITSNDGSENIFLVTENRQLEFSQLYRNMKFSF